MSEESIVKPLFHYTYKNEGVILDQQYNYQGNMLAVCNSNGQLLFYSAETEEQNREVLFSNDRKKTSEKKNATILKIAWSLPIFGLFAAASVSREVDLFSVHKQNIVQLLCRKMDYIPLALCFCPVESEPMLTIGLSNGSIVLLGEDLKEICSTAAHSEAVNCLAWEHKILTYEKNRWIVDNFSHVKKIVSSEEMPNLVSGSTDCTIKIWKYENKQLTELCRFKAHEKAVRDVQWRPSYLIESERFVISCSEDWFVKIWKVQGSGEKNQKNLALEMKESTKFDGPVYKANFNFLGNVIAISYCNESEEKVQTILMKQNNKSLLGKKIKIHT